MAIDLGRDVNVISSSRKFGEDWTKGISVKELTTNSYHEQTCIVHDIVELPKDYTKSEHFYKTPELPKLFQ